MNQMTKLVLIAKIVSVFGVKGQVKIISFSDNPKNIAKYKLFDKDQNPIKLKINSLKRKSGSSNEIIIAQIDDIKDRNQAEKIIGKEIYANREEFTDLAEDEFYYIDLIGLEILDISKKSKLGIIKDVYDYGGGGIIEIEFNEKAQEIFDCQKVENYSFKDEFFPEINIKSGYATFQIPQFIKSS